MIRQQKINITSLKKIVLISFLLSFNLYSYTPSLESLFRGGINSNLEDKTIVLTLVTKRSESSLIKGQNALIETDATKTENLKKEEKSLALEKSSESELKTKTPKNEFIKLIYHVGKGGPGKGAVRLLQARYSDGSFQKDKLIGLKYFSNLYLKNQSVLREDKQKFFFYALMSSFTVNDGESLVEFLNLSTDVFRKNDQIISQRYKKLIYNYMSYLKRKDESVELENPFYPTEVEKKREVAKILNGPYFMQSPFVRRFLKDERLYFKVEASGAKILFDAQDHNLKELRVEGSSGTLETSLFRYKKNELHKQIFNFPELILLKNYKDEQFELRIQKIQALNIDLDGFLKIYKRYRDDFKSLDGSSKTLENETSNFVLIN